MQDGRSGNGCTAFLFPVMEGRVNEHSDAHDEPRIVHLDSDFCSSKAEIEDRGDVADPAGKHSSGIGVQANFRILTDAHACKIVLIDITENPNSGQVLDGERIGRVQAGNASRIYDLLIGDTTKIGSADT